MPAPTAAPQQAVALVPYELVLADLQHPPVALADCPSALCGAIGSLAPHDPAQCGTQLRNKPRKGEPWAALICQCSHCSREYATCTICGELCLNTTEMRKAHKRKCKAQAQAVLKELFPEADGERYGLQVALAQHARASDAAGDDDSNHAHDNEIAYTMADSGVGRRARSSLVDDEAACSGSGSDSGGVDNSEFIGSIVEALAD